MTKIYKPPSFDNQIVVPKEIFTTQISLAALGFYCWLFTQKANVPITFEKIKKDLGVTDHTIRKQIKELESLKFLSRIPVRNSGKFGGYNYFISDVTMLKKPHTVKRTRSAAYTNINTNNNNTNIIYNNNNNNTDKNKNDKIRAEIEKNIKHFLALFPEKYQPKKKSELQSWIDCMYKLMTKENYKMRQIYNIIKTIRLDKFWSVNFLTLLKLRKKNKDGIKYIDFFNEICNAKKPDGYWKVKSLQTYFIYEQNNTKMLGAIANDLRLSEYNLKNILTDEQINNIKQYVQAN